MLEGKKTYIVAFGIIASAIGAFMSNQIDLMSAINQALTGLGLATLRIGIAGK